MLPAWCVELHNPHLATARIHAGNTGAESIGGQPSIMHKVCNSVSRDSRLHFFVFVQELQAPTSSGFESSIHGFPMFSTIFDGHKCPMSSPCQDTFRRHHVSIKIGLPVIGGSLGLNTSKGHLSIKNCPEYGCPMLPTAGLLNAALDDEKTCLPNG